MNSKNENLGNIFIEGGIEIGSLMRSYSQFHEALKVSKSDLEKAGTILFFRSTYALCWKTMQRLLQARGLELNSPKTVLREAALEKLIDRAEPWLEFAGAISKAEGRYDKSIANEVFADLNLFDREAEALIKKLRALS